jgi:uncharacterized protein YuzB (UPF0349 family)
MLILNFDFPAMRSIYGKHALYRKFGSCVNVMEGTDGSTDVAYNPNVDTWCGDVARNVLYYLDNQMVLAGATETRLNKNIYRVYRRHIEPLIYA